MSEEATSVLKKNAEQPKLRIVCGETIISCSLSGCQSVGRPSKQGNPQISIPKTTVSRRHGEFLTQPDGCRYRDLGSMNGTLLNNRMLQPGEYVLLKDGDVLKIPGETEEDSVFMVYTASDAAQTPSTDPSAGRLSIHIEERNVWHKMRKQTLLKDIHLEIETGKMVLILGGSGAGKTTFMNAVMGYEQAEGEILYNDTDIYSEYERMKYEIGYVPQQDLLRFNDTVYDTLYNAAKMRLPVSLSPKELEEKTRKTMQMLGLEREQGSLVGKLSGGQRKRLSIAVEYIGEPSLFSLDEPDSGLDGVMARELMENLRTIADDGRIVMVISHSPDRAFELFDQVIVLAKDSRDNSGHLVFTGSPKAALRFFETENLEGIVRRINRPDEGGEGRADEFITRFTREAQNGQ
jgi:ABC-type multidrug transport system ATPase subunit